MKKEGKTKKIAAAITAVVLIIVAILVGRKQKKIKKQKKAVAKTVANDLNRVGVNQKTIENLKSKSGASSEDSIDFVQALFIAARGTSGLMDHSLQPCFDDESDDFDGKENTVHVSSHMYNNIEYIDFILRVPDWTHRWESYKTCKINDYISAYVKASNWVRDLLPNAKVIHQLRGYVCYTYTNCEGVQISETSEIPQEFYKTIEEINVNPDHAETNFFKYYKDLVNNCDKDYDSLKDFCTNLLKEVVADPEIDFSSLIMDEIFLGWKIIVPVANNGRPGICLGNAIEILDYLVNDFVIVRGDTVHPDESSAVRYSEIIFHAPDESGVYKFDSWYCFNNGKVEIEQYVCVHDDENED